MRSVMVNGECSKLPLVLPATERIDSGRTKMSYDNLAGNELVQLVHVVRLRTGPASVTRRAWS